MCGAECVLSVLFFQGFRQLLKALVFQKFNCELTEKLRGRQTEGSEELYQKVAEAYEATVTVLKELENF